MTSVPPERGRMVWLPATPRYGYVFRHASLAGRRRVHVIAMIAASSAERPLWQADTTVCGAPPPWDFDIESPWQRCGRCRAGIPLAFSAAPPSILALVGTAVASAPHHPGVGPGPAMDSLIGRLLEFAPRRPARRGAEADVARGAGDIPVAERS